MYRRSILEPTTIAIHGWRIIYFRYIYTCYQVYSVSLAVDFENKYGQHYTVGRLREHTYMTAVGFESISRTIYVLTNMGSITQK